MSKELEAMSAFEKICSSLHKADFEALMPQMKILNNFISNSKKALTPPTKLDKLADLISRGQLSKAQILTMINTIRGVGNDWEIALTDEYLKEYDEFLKWKKENHQRKRGNKMSKEFRLSDNTINFLIDALEESIMEEEGTLEEIITDCLENDKMNFYETELIDEVNEEKCPLKLEEYTLKIIRKLENFLKSFKGEKGFRE